MPIATIANGEGGASVRAKLNETITQTNESATTVVGLVTGLQSEISSRKSLIDTTESAPLVDYTDPNGFVGLRIDQRGQMISSAYRLERGGSDFEIADPNGFVTMRIRNGATAIGGLSQQGAGAVVAWDATPLMSDLMCGVSGIPIHLYLRNMMVVRSDESRVRGSILAAGSNDGVRPSYTRTGDDDLVIDLAAAGPSATLVMRPSGQTPDKRILLPVTIKTAPRPASGASPVNVLMIGDSITNRQIAKMLRDKLTAWGYAPTMIGTMRGSGYGEGSTGTGGELGEGREGWEYGDYTYAVTDRALAVAPGEEAAYLARSKTEQRDYNPFIRAATAQDDAAVVRNGYVFDFAFYLQRFGLATPNVVTIGLGTNEIRDRDGSELVGNVSDSMTIMRRQIRAAAPNARIVFWFPPASRSVDRDSLWPIEYVPVLRTLIATVRGFADARTVLAPVWAMGSQEEGGAYASITPDPANGTTDTTVTDPVHPGVVTRHQIAEALAGYAACVAANLI